ncbi:hypothetical protein QBA54_25705 [Streptomyces sp. B21-108]|uniref:hypothetical protein n=1 Tax=Streptomyces sp. B21-108 TaxID=3039419 RepID=UPI002FF0AFB4
MLYGGKRRYRRHGLGEHAVVRVLMLAVAVAGLFLCVDRVETHRPDLLTYRSASLCPAGTPWKTADDCVARITGEVVDKTTSQSCTWDSGGGQSCTTDYDLKVRFGPRTKSLGVESSTYRATDRGDQADLRLWRGQVVRMVVQGHVETYLTSDEWAFAGWLILAWAMLAASWLALFGLWLYPLLWGWLVLTVPYVMLASNLLGLNPMGVTGWSLLGVFTAAGLGALGYALANGLD